MREYDSHVCLYKHDKTGAELISVINGDENKTFGAVFRTPVGDSTGIPHILVRPPAGWAAFGGGGAVSGGGGDAACCCCRFFLGEQLERETAASLGATNTDNTTHDPQHHNTTTPQHNQHQPNQTKHQQSSKKQEHSVLCGSRKYPIKEPFVELMKGSLNTFLNAFTYPDRTCYPVASTNAQVRAGGLVIGGGLHM